MHSIQRESLLYGNILRKQTDYLSGILHDWICIGRNVHIFIITNAWYKSAAAPDKSAFFEWPAE